MAEELTLEEKFAIMEQQIAALTEQNARLQERREDDAVQAQDELQRAIDAMDRQYRVPVPGAYGQEPCVGRDRDGNVCGKSWDWHKGMTVEQAGHSYRRREPVSVPARPGMYAKDAK